MAKRGRPIKWEEAFDKYKSTAQFYTKRAGTRLNDRYIRDIDEFKEKVSGYRETYGWGVAKATSFLAQTASLNQASLKQVQALQRVAEEFGGEKLTFKQAVLTFESGSMFDADDVIDLVEANEWNTPEKLAAAVRGGEMTISELYKYLQTDIPGTKERRDWISQNVFGSD